MGDSLRDRLFSSVQHEATRRPWGCYPQPSPLRGNARGGDLPHTRKRRCLDAL